MKEKREARGRDDMQRERGAAEVWWAVPSPARSVLHPPVILLPQHVWQKLLVCAQAVPTEVAGIGTAAVAEGVVTITDVWTLAQRVTRSAAVIDGETIAAFLDDFVARGGNPEDLCVQWHSHGAMPVFWSLDDEANIEGYFGLAPLAVSLELNHHGGCLGRVDLRSPVRLSVEAEVQIVLDPPPAEVCAAWSAETQRHAVAVRVGGGRIRTRKRTEGSFHEGPTDSDSPRGA